MSEPVRGATYDQLRNAAREFPHSERFGNRQSLFQQLAHDGVAPRVMMIASADSKVDPALVCDADPGSLFVMRNVANIVPPFGVLRAGAAASIEYAVHTLRVEHVIVCGNSECGAIHRYVEAEDPKVDRSVTPALAEWLEFLQPTRDAFRRAQPLSPETDAHAWCVQHNVLLQLHHLAGHPCVAKARESKQLELHGWYYDVATGEVFEATSLRFTDDPCSQFELL